MRAASQVMTRATAWIWTVFCLIRRIKYIRQTIQREMHLCRAILCITYIHEIHIQNVYIVIIYNYNIYTIKQNKFMIWFASLIIRVSNTHSGRGRHVQHVLLVHNVGCTPKFAIQFSTVSERSNCRYLYKNLGKSIIGHDYAQSHNFIASELF